MFIIIAKKIVVQNRIFYEPIFNNIPAKSMNQLALLIQLWNEKVFSNIQENQDSDEYNGILIRYNLFKKLDSYIIFYDSGLDDYWESVCNKKYGQEGFVWDEETPMLKFSKNNFKHISHIWKKLSKIQPQYLVITQDNTGWIDLQSKEELSNEERQSIG
ncbi:hypothetical protein HYV10_00025 [Candidatus Dependentiae bacterium]|nr:hypothetical protein [Candidatus Dependentiae bacterium]